MVAALFPSSSGMAEAWVQETGYQQLSHGRVFLLGQASSACDTFLPAPFCLGQADNARSHTSRTLLLKTGMELFWSLGKSTAILELNPVTVVPQTLLWGRVRKK